MKLVDVATQWGVWKERLMDDFAVSADALHVHVSVLLFVLSALLLRRRLSSAWPWLVTLLIELCNEWIDLHQKVGSPESNWPASWHDIKNTMIAPTLILIVANLQKSGWLRPR